MFAKMETSKLKLLAFSSEMVSFQNGDIVFNSGDNADYAYVIMEGAGTMTFGSGSRPVKKGDFVYLPPWCLHGIENTGTEMLVVLICTSPPNP
jgi:mannose-6-phosphate isomerase-like protein (cupin superfamily)